MCESVTVVKPHVEASLGRTVNLPFAVVLERVEQALEREGFGVLTRVDVKETLKKRLDVERGPFVVLGACHPRLAHQALGLEPRVGLLLPCNVVVREVSPGMTRVEAMDPLAMTELFPKADLEGIAREVGQKLGRAIDAFAGPGAPGEDAHDRMCAR